MLEQWEKFIPHRNKYFLRELTSGKIVNNITKLHISIKTISTLFVMVKLKKIITHTFECKTPVHTTFCHTKQSNIFTARNILIIL